MKRAICIILILLCACSLFARDRHVTSSVEGRHAEDLLQDGLYENREELLSITPLLTPQERTLLFNNAKVSPIAATLENTFLGLGIGSFSVGDTTGGLIQLGCELGGAVLGAASLGYFLSYGFVGFIEIISGNPSEDTGTIVEASAVGMLIGAGAFIGGRIYGIVRGIKYPNQYNRDLQDTLYGTSGKEPHISLSPILNPSGIGIGVGVKF
ncbi:MAG: P13 family porin [Treponema sp.]|nr:P13 family porin [Candidatus Treponema caballi]